MVVSSSTGYAAKIDTHELAQSAEVVKGLLGSRIGQVESVLNKVIRCIRSIPVGRRLAQLGLG